MTQNEGSESRSSDQQDQSKQKKKLPEVIWLDSDGEEEDQQPSLTGSIAPAKLLSGGAVKKEEKMSQQNQLEEIKLIRKRKAELEKPAGMKQNLVHAVTMDADGVTLRGEHDEANLYHLNIVKKYFDKGKKNTRMKIVAITYFVNTHLEAEFQAAKYALSQIDRDTTEITLFHGTALSNISSILETGFHIGGVSGKVVNGAAFGIGVYLASNPGLSWFYCGGGCQMFACSVVPGLTTTNPMNTQPKKAGENMFDAYKNASFGPEFGDVYVVRDAALVLPRYLIEFDADLMNDHFNSGNGFLPPLPATRGQPTLPDFRSKYTLDGLREDFTPFMKPTGRKATIRSEDYIVI